MTFWYARNSLNRGYTIGQGDHEVIQVGLLPFVPEDDGAHWAQQTAQFLCSMLNERERKMRKLAEEIDVE